MSSKVKVIALLVVSLLSFAALNFLASYKSLDGLLPRQIAHLVNKPALVVGMIHIDPAFVEYSLVFDDAVDKAVSSLSKKVELKKQYVPIDENTERSVEDLITHDNCKLILADSAEYQPVIFKLAAKYPKVKFEYVGGSKISHNVGTFFGDIYKVRYLSGVVAGLMVKHGFVGYVAYEKTPLVLNELNAFTLGIQSVNPKLPVKVIWTHNRSDALTCRLAGLKLLDLGAELIAQHVDVIYPSIVAVQRGKYAIGNNSDFRKSLNSERVLTSVTWHWEVHFLEAIRSVLEHTWKAQRHFNQINDNASLARLAELSSLVSDQARQQVATYKQQLTSGKLRLFCGELRDNEGHVRQTAEKCLTREDLDHTDWLVAGISEVKL